MTYLHFRPNSFAKSNFHVDPTLTLLIDTLLFQLSSKVNFQIFHSWHLTKLVIYARTWTSSGMIETGHGPASSNGSEDQIRNILLLGSGARDQFQISRKGAKVQYMLNY